MNKVESSLSAEELGAFIEECHQTKGLTLSKIQELAKARGIEISLMGAKSFRDKNFEAHLRRLRAAAEIADQIEELNDSGSGKTLADASAALLSKEVFDLIAGGGVGSDDSSDLDTLSKVVARLRTGDQRAKLLEMKVEEYEQAKAKVKAIADKARSKGSGGITEETLREVEEAIGLL